MSDSEKLSIEYAKRQVEIFGQDPFYISKQILNLALKLAFQEGFVMGQNSMLIDIHGIVEKGFEDETIRKNN